MKIFLKDILVDSPDRSSITKIFRSDLSGDIRGHLVILLSIKAKGKVDANQIAPFIINGVGMGAKSAKTPIECLKRGLEEGEKQLRELIRHDHEAELGLDVNLSMVLVQEGKAYIGMLGSHEIRLYHDENLVDVTEILETNNVQTCSLVIGEDDYFILTSSKLFFEQLSSSATPSNATALFQDIIDTQNVLEPGQGLLLLSSNMDFETLLEEYRSPSSLEVENDKVVAPHNSALFDTVLTEEDLHPNDEIVEDMPVDRVSTEAFVDDHGEEIDEEGEELLESSLADEEEVAQKIPIDVVDSSDESPRLAQAVPVSIAAAASQFKKNAGVKVATVDPVTENSVKSKFRDIRKPLKEFKSGIDMEDVKGKIRNVSQRTQSKLSPTLNRAGTKLTSKYNTVSAKASAYLSQRYGRKLWFKRLMAKLSQTRINTGRAPGIRLGEYRDKAGRKSRYMKIGLAFAVVILVFSGWRVTQNWKYNAEIHDQFMAQVAKVDESLTKAESKINSSTEDAVLALFNAEKELGMINNVDALSEEDQKVYADLGGRVLGLSDQISKVTVLSEDSGNISLFADGRIDFDSKSSPTDIAIFRNSELVEQLFISDRGTGAVYRVPTIGQDVKKIPDTSGLVKTPIYVDIGVNGIYVFDETAGVLKAPFAGSDAEITTFVAVSGASRDNFEAESIDEFSILTSVDNIYVLSKSANAVFKSQATSSGSYGLPFVYLEDSRFSTASDFFADLNIYVLTGGAQGINRYVFNNNTSALEEFPLEFAGMKDSFQNLTAGYTGADLSKKMYVFDQSSKRIIIFAKPNEADGTNSGMMVLQKQLEYRGNNTDLFNNVADIVVDEAERYMYVLDGTKVWKISL